MTGAVAPSSRVGVVVPIRSFIGAKARLADHLDEDERAAALRQMADRVIDAASPMQVVVVTSAPEVRRWAQARRAEVLDDPGSLDGAATSGVEHLRVAGLVRAVVAHADLPRARSLAPLTTDLERRVVVLVPCHREDGTNVLSVPTDLAFPFAYGPGSFQRHLTEARRLDVEVRILRPADLTIDVDTPDDLQYLGSSSVVP
jgi:2-phospho-L-lactate guanylyltransferase